MFSNKAFAFLLIIYGFECIACWPITPVADQSSNYIVSNVKVTWREAFILCKQNGMELVSINSAEEHDALAKIVDSSSMKRGYSFGYWTAGVRFGSLGNAFAWFTTGKPIVFSKFGRGEPNNAGNIEDCVEYFMEKGLKTSYVWNDITCDHKTGYICQYAIATC